MATQPIESPDPSWQQNEAGRARPPARQELINQFTDLIERVSTGVGPSMLEAWSEIELTIDQFRALALLRQGPQRITDIASALGIRLSAASTFVDRLEAKRLVERFHDAEDRRVVRCRLTALGAKEAQSLWHLNRQRVEHLATILGRDELEKVLEILRVLAAAVDRDSPRDSPSPAAPADSAPPPAA